MFNKASLLFLLSVSLFISVSISAMEANDKEPLLKNSKKTLVLVGSWPNIKDILPSNYKRIVVYTPWPNHGTSSVVINKETTTVENI